MAVTGSEGANNRGYQHPLTGRYASPPMQAVFSAQNRFTTWRRLWIALAESQSELGIEIDDAQIQALRDGLEDLDLDRAAEYERRFRHDVMAHVHLYGDVAPSAAGILHLGATSAYVADNADLILHREALALVRNRLLRVIRVLADFAARFRATPTLAFTHFQPAQPTTVGKRATLWIQDFMLDLEEIDFRLDRLRLRGAKGTTGTQASFLQLFQGDHDRVERLDAMVAEKMGFAHRYGVTGQTYPRKVDQALLATLAGIGASASKFGNDLRLLAHLKEVEEPYETEQIGSSAMPYKRNPMRAERMCALARHAITLSQDAAFTAATQWLERSLDDSANKRVSVPDSYLTIDGVLVLAENVSDGLIVNEALVRAHLLEELPFMSMEPVLMEAAARGGDRQVLHERIRVHARAAAERLKAGAEDNDLLDRVADDPDFRMDRAALEDLMDPQAFVGRAPEQVDAFLATWVEPVLADVQENVTLAAEVRV